MAEVKTIAVKMVVDKETPGTIRFRENVAAGEHAEIGTLYVPKATYSRLGGPQTLTVTIER